MVNSISNTPTSHETGQRASVGSAATSSAKSITKTDSSDVKSSAMGSASASGNQVSAPVAENAAALAAQALNPPFTSLALYKDPESGLQVSVVRDKMTGEVEQIPTERMRKLAAMYKEQEDMAAARQDGGSTLMDI